MSKPKKVWGARVMPDVTGRHLKTFYAAAFATILLAVLINALQPYLLTTVLNIPLRDHGQVSGQVGFVSEVVLVLMLAVFGVMSDRIGRRWVYALGFLLVGIGLALTPFYSSLVWLMVTRGVFAIGIAAATAMLATVAADYVMNKDRGKANAIMGIMNGIGAVAAAVGLAKLPKLFQAMGQDGVQAAKSTYLLAGGLALVFGMLMLWGLKKGRPQHESAEEHDFSLFHMLGHGLRAGRHDIGISLSYAAAFVARADLAVAGVFFPLWLTKHFSAQVDGQLSGVDKLMAIDMAAASGVAAGGKLIAIIGSAGLMFAPVIGLLCDRINRVQALMIGLALNALGYGLTIFIHDPTGTALALISIIIGFGQVGAVIASQVLIQDLAPASERGSIIGTFGTFGAFGIMLSLLGGGWLFDKWTEAGPFVMLAILNLVVLLAAWSLKSTVSRRLIKGYVSPQKFPASAGISDLAR